MENAVLERLSQPDANLLISNSEHDLTELQDRRAALVVKFDQLVELLSMPLQDAGSRPKYKTEIGKIAASPAKLARTSPAAALLASGVELRKRWEAMSPSLLSQVVDELVSVTILPCTTRGTLGFNPDFIRLEWETG